MKILYCLVFLFVYFRWGMAVYLTMKDIEVTIPGGDNLLPSNTPILTLYGQYDNHSKRNLRYSINETNGYMRVYATKGDVLFTKKFLNKGIGTISSLVSAQGADDTVDRTTLTVNVSPLNPFDCELILESLCFWTKISYQIMEEKEPTIIGPLASPYVWKMCPAYKLNYTMQKNNGFDITQSTELEKYWSLKTTKSLNRDLNGYTKNISVICIVENQQGSIKEVIKSIKVDILDVNNNQPVPQDDEAHINLTSNTYKKGDRILDAPNLLFFDLDSPSLNNLVPSILGKKQSELFKPHCETMPDTRNNKNSTVCYCDLILLKDIYFAEENYSLILELNDTANTNKNATSGKINIHLHFNSAASIESEDPLNLYPQRIVKIFRSAGPLARITQPKHATNCTNFQLHMDKKHKKLFGITSTEGIVHVLDSDGLRKAPEYVRINLTWNRDGKQHQDNIRVRIVDESSPSCIDTSYEGFLYTFCSMIDNAADCLSANYCAIATGGSESVRTRNNSERCMWRGDKNPGNEATNHYATCTPETSTCPDDNCDALEQLYIGVCPQDCTEKLAIPATHRKGGRGIDKANGVCTCDTTGGCKCDPVKKKKRKMFLTTASTPVPFILTSIQPVADIPKHSAKCGATCVIGIIAGTLFLGGAVAMIVICWRLDRVHKAVRGKYSDESQEITAPLSDYVDRNNQPESMSFNFHMTTSLGDATSRNIINKFSPDPKWEFPRSQLVIEQTLGEGEFGRVLRAKASNIAGYKGFTTVAVKTLKDDARETELNDLLSEYQLLKEVSHPNIIRLLGVCTVSGGPVYLIIEFAELGSLRNYLRRRRHLKSEIPRLHSSTDMDENTETHYDEPNVDKITSKEILSLAWQICKGMAYLSDIKLVHRDLAARNVLLTKDKICKISDFGLTRDIYEDNAYFKRSKGRVPVKWMAPESLSDHIYTSKSDVWSFGILVWELVTLGANPYPGIAVQNLFHLIRQGYRMERPDNCSPALYKIIRRCWQVDPEARPTFHELSKLWEKMLEDGNEYLDFTNNAIHNRSYFCSPFEINEADNDLSPRNENESNPDNYLSKSISYEKCGASCKLISEDNVNENENVHESNIQNNNTKGYETPVKVPQKLHSSEEGVTGYTDMQAIPLK